MIKILQNEIKCKKCDDIIWSAHRHDFKNCKCGAIAVDGGLDYCRRVGELNEYEERSISMEHDTYKALKESLKWCKDTGRNDFGVICAVMRTLRDHGYDLTIKEE